jgi:translation initiation factor 6
LIGSESLVGSYSVFSNHDGVITPKVTIEEINEIAGQMGVEVIAATVNKGNEIGGNGIVVNDWSLFCGWDTTALEVANLSRIFKIEDNLSETGKPFQIDESLIDLIF